jgi:hypothetical protein
VAASQNTLAEQRELAGGPAENQGRKWLAKEAGAREGSQWEGEPEFRAVPTSVGRVGSGRHLSIGPRPPRPLS